MRVKYSLTTSDVEKIVKDYLGFGQPLDFRVSVSANGVLIVSDLLNSRKALKFLLRENLKLHLGVNASEVDIEVILDGGQSFSFPFIRAKDED